MHAIKPSLPAPYELVTLDAVDSVLAEACRRAAAGAEEGTLIWAGQQHAARTRRGHPWHAPPGNLHCAVIMRPDYPRQRSLQLCHVAALAAGAAIAESVSPMTGLSYGWPGDLLINDLQAGLVQMRAGPEHTDPWRWVAIALSVNVAHHPPNPEPERFNSIHASGDSDHVAAVDVLEHFARHFLRWVNQWAELGYACVRTPWLQRAHSLVENARMLDLLGECNSGSPRLTDDGALLAMGSGGAQRRIGIDDYYAISQ